MEGERNKVDLGPLPQLRQAWLVQDLLPRSGRVISSCRDRLMAAGDSGMAGDTGVTPAFFQLPILPVAILGA